MSRRREQVGPCSPPSRFGAGHGTSSPAPKVFSRKGNRVGASTTELWQSLPPADAVVAPVSRPSYLANAIAPGLVVASSVRLRMHGEIRLKKWRAFEAEEVLHRDRGFVWQADVCPFRGTHQNSRWAGTSAPLAGRKANSCG